MLFDYIIHIIESFYFMSITQIFFQSDDLLQAYSLLNFGFRLNLGRCPKAVL